jgi:hypothetical protein
MSGLSQTSYQAMSITQLAAELAAETTSPGRRRLVLEFVEEYRHEDERHRASLLIEEPAPTGDPRYDALLGGLAEHLAYHDGRPAPAWTYGPSRFLDQWWFPIDLPSVRADALVHSPGAFRIRGVFLGSGALDRS